MHGRPPPISAASSTAHDAAGAATPPAAAPRVLVADDDMVCQRMACMPLFCRGVGAGVAGVVMGYVAVFLDSNMPHMLGAEAAADNTTLMGAIVVGGHGAALAVAADHLGYRRAARGRRHTPMSAACRQAAPPWAPCHHPGRGCTAVTHARPCHAVWPVRWGGGHDVRVAWPGRVTAWV